MKWLYLPLALLVLSACDSEKLPPRPETPPTPKVEAPVDTPKPQESLSLVPEPTLGDLQDDDGKPPEIQTDVEPVTAGDPETLPSERVAPAAAPKPAVAKTKKEVPVEQVEIPEVELDLSLPEDWATNSEPEQNTASISLLPPMFGTERARSVQLSGSLLPALDRDDEIDGAQLNFELKR